MTQPSTKNLSAKHKLFVEYLNPNIKERRRTQILDNINSAMILGAEQKRNGVKITPEDIKKWGEENNFIETVEETTYEAKVETLGGKSPTKTNTTARYPSDALMDESSDYVYFQFGKYKPPFSKEGSDKKFSQVSYNQSIELEERSIPIPGGPKVNGIVLPMPQDLGNDIQQTWNGKQFSALGRAAIAGSAGGNFALLGNRIRDIDGSITSTIASLQTTILNKIPGVGGNLDINDITGSTRGIVLNPNAEILYETAELREIGMTFKMIPRSQEEAKIIKSIVYMFRYASVPAWGGNEPGETWNDDNDKALEFKKDSNESGEKTNNDQAIGKDNFIRVPYLCQFRFMTGSNMNDKIEQFKPCAIRKVAVNYTSDGTYATYRDGEPVATELTLNFLESKLLFKKDIIGGY